MWCDVEDLEVETGTLKKRYVVVMINDELTIISYPLTAAAGRRERHLCWMFLVINKD